MSPLAQLILRALRAGAIVSAGLLVVFIAIELAKNYFVGRVPEPRDWGFLAVLVTILFVAVLLIRAITRELRR